MSLDGFFTWGDDGFETKWRPILVRASRVGFSYWELTNGEAQEVKANATLILLKGMGYACLAWLQFQSHVSSPYC